ncbi:uncharacterized protein LAESUDRAFT_667778, partial [Laetiporus sulphureus 93-53]
DVPFEFGEEQIAAMEDLKAVLLESPALRAINYNSDASVILAVDTSNIAVRYQLCQCAPDNPKVRYFSRFSSIMLNDQPKLKLYSLFHALRALKVYLIGIRNLIVEVDARYIKEMLKHPDITSFASINRWIVVILMFHFKLIHIPGVNHGLDGLSRRPAQSGDALDDTYENEDFDD